MIRSSVLSFLSDLSSAVFFESWSAVGTAAALFLGSCALGLLVVPSGIARPAARALAGFPLLFILGGATAIGLYLLGGTVRAGLAVVLAASAVAVALALWRGVARAFFAPRELLLVAFLLLAGLVFAFFGWGETADGTVRAMSGSWGDGPLHTLIAEAFARRSPTSLLEKLRGAGGSDLGMPAFAGEQLREPFGYDFVAAMLRSAGFTVGGAFTLPVAALLACLLAWAGQVTATLATAYGSQPAPRWAPVVSGVLLLTFGGLQWLVMAQRTDSWSLGQFFGLHNPAWDKVESLGLVWANHVNTFVSQRHLLLASAFLLVLVALLLSALRGEGTRSLVAAAIGTGLLSLFHAHALLAGGLLWAAALLLKRSRSLVALGVLALLLALPAVVWQSGLFRRAGFLSFAPGWMASGGLGGWIVFWVMNLGVFLPLVIAGVWRAARRARAASLLLAIPAGALFVLGNTVQFQPYLWDNFKLFFFAWVILLPLAVAEMARWRFRGALGVVLLLVFAMSLTTLSDVATRLHFRSTYPVYDPADRAAARLLDARLPRDAVILADTDTEHNHPLTLTGRTLALGYGGWIWTRNYAWDDRLSALAQLRAADAQTFCALARQLGITHVVDERFAVRGLQETC